MKQTKFQCVDNITKKKYLKHSYIRGTMISGTTTSIQCEHCRSYLRDDKLTAQEIIAVGIHRKRVNQNGEELHKTYHAWTKAVGNKIGYDAMLIAERFNKKHPESTQIVSVDDNHFSGSDLLLIDHVSESSGYWGTTVVFIPQCAGGPPVEFFLYPGHRKGLQAALSTIVSRSQKVKRRPIAWPIKHTRVKA